MRTRTKIALARAIRSGLRAAATPWGGLPAEVRREGVRWTIDWDDGIELSIALLGGFERRVQRACRARLPQGGVALDVGANVGAIALPLAAHVGAEGVVHAFEPTVRGVERLGENLSLNPELRSRVVVHHAFVGTRDSVAPRDLPARWPVSGGSIENAAGHGGVACPTDGAVTLALDDLLESGSLPRVDLIKLDVDGHEASVLEGSARLLADHRPPIVMELAPDAHDEVDATGFRRMLEIVVGAGYRLRDLRGRSMPCEEAHLRSRIPRGSGCNVVAEHPEGSHPRTAKREVKASPERTGDR